jgi:hypothetical protein
LFFSRSFSINFPPLSPELHPHLFLSGSNKDWDNFLFKKKKSGWAAEDRKISTKIWPCHNWYHPKSLWTFESGLFSFFLFDLLYLQAMRYLRVPLNASRRHLHRSFLDTILHESRFDAIGKMGKSGYYCWT